jgi:hypothetical protein
VGLVGVRMLAVVVEHDIASWVDARWDAREERIGACLLPRNTWWRCFVSSWSRRSGQLKHSVFVWASLQVKDGK